MAQRIDLAEIHEALAKTALMSMNRTQASAADFSRYGVTAAMLAGLVRDGVMRRGIQGFWMAQVADPGAVFVMQSMMNEKRTSDESEL